MTQVGATRTGGVGRRLLGPAAVLGAVAAGTTWVALVDPHEPGRYPTCPLLWATGLYCPGCGALRMVHELAHGRLDAALGLNPLLFALLPVFGYLYARWVVLSVQGRPMSSRLLRPAAVYTLLALVIVFWVVRNLPFGASLAP
ncbi:DUF2752 domain-containing protein [Thermomonospora catenispora]|uniref:DUF2752 domain-containing protein n=1 Tax=Thermomonospora catenispora TaxID=2493090 RepID=UPI0011245516|nr:DUF2752 domain-containing protein [Thermomonospora catenispora]TNY34893.1 DUF2752 domain-containing protein [Thermomonospora catenispora]